MRFAGSKIAGFIDEGPSYDKIGAKSVINAAQDSVNTSMNNARTSDAVLSGKAQIAAAEHYGDAARAAGAAQGQASMISGIAGGIGGLGGLFKSSRGGGGISSSDSYLGGYSLGSSLADMM